MRVLFVHRHFPGQYPHLARSFAADPRNKVAFITTSPDGEIPGVRKIVISQSRQSGPPTHHYLQFFENAVLQGQAAYRACMTLRRAGFIPDLIYAHAGFGPGLYIKEAFLDSPLIGHFEWYYSPHGSDADYLGDFTVTPDEALRVRTRNAELLLELAQCDRGLSPTRFQRDQFPTEFHDKIAVIHEGIDSRHFRPASAAVMIPGLNLPSDAEIVTYATRGLEPYRGFPQFMAAIASLQPSRQRMHAVIVGADAVFYGAPRDDGLTWKEATLRSLPQLDTTRVHFLGRVDAETHLRVLQASHAHVYLTVPFVLSWSLMESMAAGCPLVGSDTAPVREVIRDGETGLLADMRKPAEIADRIAWFLDHAADARAIGRRARIDATARYGLDTIMPQHMELAQSLTGSVARRTATG